MPPTREILIRLHTSSAAGVFRFLRSMGLEPPLKMIDAGSIAGLLGGFGLDVVHDFVRPHIFSALVAV